MRVLFATWLVAGLLGFSLRTALAGSPPTILIDEAHGEKFVVEAPGKLDLSGLADTLRSSGAKLEPNNKPLSAERLAHVDALIISGAFKAFSPAEVDAVIGFVQRGGRLAVMLHIPFPLTPLLRQLHIDFSNGVIRERENLIGGEALNFQVKTLSPHALTQNVESLSVFGAWALMNEDSSATVIARSSPQAWIDLNGNNQLDKGDAVQSFAVAVVGQLGQGQFVVFGDDAIFQNQFLKDGNATLAKNLACWLVPGECDKKHPI